MKIPLGTQKIYTDRSGHNQLLKFYFRCLELKNTIVEICFRDLQWLDGNLCALLEAMLYVLSKNNNLKFEVDVEFLEKKFSILFRNGFLRDLSQIPNFTNTALELHRFNQKDDINFVNYIDDTLLSHSSLKMSKEAQEKISSHFMEIFANVEIHAQTNDPIFACGQYFPMQRELKFTLVDLGIGYLPSIKKFTNHKIVTSKDAIKWALKNENTTKKEALGGNGLYEVLNYCKQDGGDFNIITGDAFWGNNLGLMGTRQVKPFLGTIIHLNFKC